MSVIRRYIRLRYKLFPYLYNLFIDQEQDGEPILRPLFYEFEGKDLDKIDDEFLVGPSILQAPFVDDVKKRTVVLPGDGPWFDAATGDWRESGEHVVRAGRDSTPLFIPAGAIVAMQPGTPTDNTKELREVHLHLFFPSGWSGETDLVYRADDGISYGYRSGARSAIKVRVAVADGNVAIAVTQTEDGFGLISPTFVLHSEPKSVRVNGAEVTLSKNKVTLAGKPLVVTVVS